MQSFIRKQETLNLGPKIRYLGTFGLQFDKSYYRIFNQNPGICENIKFHRKQKKYSWDQKCAIRVFGPVC